VQKSVTDSKSRSRRGAIDSCTPS
jgi:uncharacterized membrane protein YfhO